MSKLSYSRRDFLKTVGVGAAALALPGGIVVTLVISWLTRPEPAEKLRNFYTLLATPIGKEQQLRDAGAFIITFIY